MIDLVFYLTLLIFSVIVHEVSHGIVAYWQGDDTAYRYGRLTLNPVPHLDLMGSVIFPAVCVFLHLPVLGWAKPVPVNPNRFNHYRSGTILVSLAGPLSNFLLALIAALLFRWSVVQPLAPMGLTFLPSFLAKAVLLNLALMIFNLLPIPPLDGSQVAGVMFPAIDRFYNSISSYGMFIIIGLMAFGILGRIIFPPLIFLFNLLTGGMGGRLF